MSNVTIVAPRSGQDGEEEAESYSALARAYECAFETYGSSCHASVSYVADVDEAQALLETGQFDTAYIAGTLAAAGCRVADVEGASAKLSRGADCLIRHAGQVFGLMLSGTGCVRHLEHEGYSLAGARVAVCGLGSAALSVVQAAAVGGASRIALISSNKESSQGAMERFIARYKKMAYATMDLKSDTESWRSFREAYEEPDYVFGAYSSATKEIAAADVIFRLNPKAAGSRAARVPFDEELIGSQSLICDTALEGDGPLVVAAKQAQCPSLDGRGMIAAVVADHVSMVEHLTNGEADVAWDEVFEAAHQAICG